MDGDLDEEPAADEVLEVVQLDDESLVPDLADDETGKEVNVVVPTVGGRPSRFGDSESGARSTARVGPRVLGRIELPASRRGVKTEVKRPVGSVSAPVPNIAAAVMAPIIVGDDEDEEGNRKGGRGKSRKREISRTDLVDYEGREGGRRVVKGGKAGGRGGRNAQKGGAAAAEVFSYPFTGDWLKNRLRCEFLSRTS